MKLYTGFNLGSSNSYLGIVVESTYNGYWLVDLLMAFLAHVRKGSKPLLCYLAATPRFRLTKRKFRLYL